MPNFSSNTHRNMPVTQVAVASLRPPEEWIYQIGTVTAILLVLASLWVF